MHDEDTFTCIEFERKCNNPEPRLRIYADWRGVKTDKVALNEVKYIGISKNRDGSISKLITKMDDKVTENTDEEWFTLKDH